MVRIATHAARHGARILVFARVPQPGRVKTRLIPALGAEAACDIHCRLVERTLALTARADATVELWLDGDPAHPAVAAWCRRYRLRVHRQHGADLGARMHRAIRHTLCSAGGALILGCDCPTLGLADLRAGLRALRTLDAVIAPARDGGYVMLGVSRPAQLLLRRMPWGTRHVLALTRRRLRASGWRYRQLRWQHDVDRPADLERVVRDTGLAETVVYRGIPDWSDRLRQGADERRRD